MGLAEQERLDNVIGHANNLESRIQSLDLAVETIAEIAERLEETVSSLKQRVDMIEFNLRRLKS